MFLRVGGILGGGVGGAAVGRSLRKGIDGAVVGVGVPFELFEMITEGVAATIPNY